MTQTLTVESAEDLAQSTPMRVLERAAAHATLWTIIAYGAGQSLRVVNSLVLTRLLLPAAFGEMSLVMTLIVGMTLLSDIGLQPSVIKSHRGDDSDFLNTAWTLQAVRGAVLWLLACALAWPAARFYHDAALVRVIPVLALGVIITGLNGTGLLTLSRHMGVRQLFAIEFSTQIVALVITIGWAWYRPSVWALVAGSLASNLFRMLVSHHRSVAGERRNRFHLDRSALDDILHFGKWIFVGTALFFFASQADRLLLGRLVTMTMLGVYSIAYQISDVPRSIVNAFAQKVGMPFASKLLRASVSEMREQFLRYRGYVLALGAFMLSPVIVWGGVLAVHIYPARYHDAGWMVPILAAGLWHTVLYNTTAPVLLSMGRARYNAVGNFAFCVTILAGIPIGFHFFGLVGAVVAVAAGDLPLYIVTQFGATREGLRPLRQDLIFTGLMAALVLVNFALRKAFL